MGTDSGTHLFLLDDIRIIGGPKLLEEFART